MRWWRELREHWHLLALGGFWLIFPVALIWTAAAVELRCERNSQVGRPACVLTTVHDFRATQQMSFPISELLGAYIEESTNSDGDTTYRLVLELERGPVPFTESFTGGRSGKQANADVVRQFVANRTQASLLVSEDNRLNNYLIAAGMTAIFIFVAVLVRRS
jgi:hypothetical protein